MIQKLRPTRWERLATKFLSNRDGLVLCVVIFGSGLAVGLLL